MLPLRTDSNFGTVLNNELIAKGITHKDLAKAVGLEPVTITRYIKARVIRRCGVLTNSMSPSVDIWRMLNKFFYPDEPDTFDLVAFERNKRIQKMIDESVVDKNVKTLWQTIEPWTLETKSIQIQKMKEIPNRKRVRNCF